MMHVVHTVDSLGEHHGGPSRSITSLCTALAERDVDVDLVSLRAAMTGSRLILPSSSRVRVRLVEGEERQFGSARLFGVELARALQSGSVIHEHGMWLPTNHETARVAAAKSVPRVVSPRGMLSPWALGFRRWKKQIAWHMYQRRDLRAATVIHVTSQEEANQVRESGSTQPIAVIPNGVELPPKLVQRKNEQPVRRALFLSRIHPVKGVLHLVEAWGRIQPANWKLLITGHDDEGHRAEVEAAVGRLGLGASVEVAGPVSDDGKWALYAEADLFVLPTLSENFGIAIAEALGSGVPVITSRGAPWSGIVTHRCGWWTDVGIPALEVALREATALNDSERREMGNRGRNFVVQEFSWKRVSADMKDVYQWVLKGGDSPATILSCRSIARPNPQLAPSKLYSKLS